jgi:hypothetical protein
MTMAGMSLGCLLLAASASAGFADVGFFYPGVAGCGLVTCTTASHGGFVHIACPDPIAFGDRCSVEVIADAENRYASPLVGPISVQTQLMGTSVAGGVVCSQSVLVGSSAACQGDLFGSFRADASTGNSACPVWGEFGVVTDASSTLGGPAQVKTFFEVCRFPGGPTSVTVYNL